MKQGVSGRYREAVLQKSAQRNPKLLRSIPRRKYVAEDKRFIQIVGALQALLAAWALLSSVTAGTQPLVSCEWTQL